MFEGISFGKQKLIGVMFRKTHTEEISEIHMQQVPNGDSGSRIGR